MLRQLREELDQMNYQNQKEINKINNMKKKREPKKVVVKRMIIGEAFQIRFEEVKEDKKNEKQRKAPLCTSHGGPTKILKKTSEFIEKSKIGSLLSMNIIFDNINKNRQKSNESMNMSSRFARDFSVSDYDVDNNTGTINNYKHL